MTSSNERHFEDIWAEAENLAKDDISLVSVGEIIAKIEARLRAYQMIDENQELPSEEKIHLRFRLMGKILAEMCQLSLKDNINVWPALTAAAQDLKIEKLAIQYKT